MTTLPPINGASDTYQPRSAQGGNAPAVPPAAANPKPAQVDGEGPSPPKDVISAERLRSATERINAFVQPVTSDITFSIDEDTGSTVVKVIDRETKDVIRQIPSEEILTIAKALDRLQGLLIRQKA